MTLGDGVRRDVATVTDEERERLRDAFLQLDTSKYTYPDGVNYWDKQEEVHKGAHTAGQDVHGGRAFCRGTGSCATGWNACCVRSIHSSPCTTGTGPPIPA
jgi:hypothetical protein